MELDVNYLQDVQEAYSSLAKLMMVIVDREGNFITELSVQDEFSKLFFYRSGPRSNLQSFIHPLRNIKKTSILDANFGGKIIVSPIIVRKKPMYFILAGYLIEANAREYALRYIETLRNPEVFKKALQSVPDYGERKKKEKVEVVKKFTRTVSTFLELLNEKNLSTNFVAGLSNGLEKIRQFSSTTIQQIKDSIPNSGLDFSGIALESTENSDQYVIDSIQGDNTEHLEGRSFYHGEGFIGQAFITQKYLFWNDVRNDPRSLLLVEMGIHIRSLFCMPIYENNAIKGVYFGGSFKEELDEKVVYVYTKLFSEVISFQLTANAINNNLESYLFKLTAFNEIFKILTSVEDIKQVLNIMLDISINFIRAPFSCIVGKPDKEDSAIGVVARGLTSERLHSYCTEVAERYFYNKEIIPDEVESLIAHTKWGNVLEFPLLFNKKLYGVFCIGLPPKGEFKRYESFLSSLSVVGSISMYLLEKDKEIDGDDGKIEMLQRMMRQLDEKKYEQLSKRRIHLQQFSKYYNRDTYQLMSRANYLLEYDVNFLRDYIKDKELLDVLSTFKQLIDNNDVVEAARKRESEILALIYLYVQQNENMKFVQEEAAISKEVRESFLQYIKQHKVLKRTVLINSERKEKPLAIEQGTEFLKSELNLSKREVDVLHLVLKGYSNLEIASELFISDHTVKNHMTKILHKLGVSDRSQAIAKIYKMGYSPIDN
ncbi:LuxR C-terminal-related transcriptional regulator [Sutcliffiella rhizosphaerae]|uniref:HTH luxR-type domain-containing protein n=1 Tax=Sutcliffiella rhizosphaerae TaxID=2880967 RepID=A0ABM8YML5_9BACI|nr:LuxR C-terminal-related transcriptional regulator [Sutcliffiella rhizosphaerae]CAG9621206.1 hypothetical protein BACCIP111883_01978 [Sutcliffiella rhizosphaerae]